MKYRRHLFLNPGLMVQRAREYIKKKSEPGGIGTVPFFYICPSSR
jgi:hypothetical protein